EGDELYKLRAKIAERIRAVTTILIVAPLGLGPLLRNVKVIAPAGMKKREEIERQVKGQLSENNPDRRFFSVRFRDAKVRMVIPDRDDPLRFQEQLFTDA